MLFHKIKEYLDKLEVFSIKQNSIIELAKNCIPFNIPDKMKYSIAVPLLVSFASHFRRHIELKDGTLVPINAITFIIANSGSGKDSSVKSINNTLQPAIKEIIDTVEKQLVEIAIEKARDAGELLPTAKSTYKKYMLTMPPIEISPTTAAGLVQHINDIGKLPMLTGILKTSEFSDELAFNQDMVDDIKILAEIYDTGDKEVKYTKDAELRSNAIKNQAVSALLIGSPGHILYDESVKKKFIIAFMTKLARRSFFCYIPEKLPEPEFASIQELIEYEEKIETLSIESKEELCNKAKKIVECNLSKNNTHLELDKEVWDLYTVYKRYNNELADMYHKQEATYPLVRRHLQWKALKLAGALAIWDCSDKITTQHFIEAIRYCELIDKDIEQFEHDLNKAPHEKFVDYIKTIIDENGTASLTVHELKKLNFINSPSKANLEQLCALAVGYDPDSIYTVVDDYTAIKYEPVKPTDTIKVSYKAIDTTRLDNLYELGADKIEIRKEKEKIARTVSYGFETVEATFEDLEELLADSFAYSPFEFKGGVRAKANIVGGLKWLVYDIDDSTISAEELHFILNHLRHYIVLSSDPNNIYRYRLLLELDMEVIIDDVAWKYFYKAIAEDLGLTVDMLPKSQIFYSYAGRPVWKNLDGDKIEARKYVIIANSESERKKRSIKINKQQAKELLEDPFNTFNYAYEAPMGQGSFSLYKVMKQAKDLGADYEYVEKVLKDINYNYWTVPMESTRFESILNQAKRILGSS